MSSPLIQAQTETQFRSGKAGPASLPRAGLTLIKLNVLCWVLFTAFLAAPLAIVVKDKVQSGRSMQEERDFVFFYSMGRMLHEYPPSRLYDFKLQKKVAMEVHPLKAGREYTPNPYPPFVALLFRPFSLLPFSTAYPLWLAITFLFYIAGIAVTAGAFFPDAPAHRSLIFCAALSLFPFWWILMGGQISAIGFIGLALAFREENRDRPLQSGLGLSLCLCKPTLLILMLPMLLITRRYRTLMGFAAGGLGLIAFSTVVEGTGVWSGYLNMLFSFGAAAASTHGYRVLHYYMDLAAFSSLLRGGRTWLGGGIIIGSACFGGCALLRAWWQHRQTGKSDPTLVWAATLTWTFVLNVYVPMYDSIMAVIGVIATAAVLRRVPDRRLHRRFTLFWMVTLIASWLSGPVAEATGFQIYTVLFALLGTFQLIALGKIGVVPAPAKPGALLPLPETSALTGEPLASKG